MPTKDPEIWTALWSWLDSQATLFWAVILSGIVAVIRMAYDGGHTIRQMCLEALLCGAITFVLTTGLDLFGIPQSASSFIGGVIGFIGVQKVREATERWIGRKV